MRSASPIAAVRCRMKAIILIAVSLAAIAVHGKATRSLNIAMPDKQEPACISRHPKLH